MEAMRKKTGKSASSLCNEDSKVQEKLDFEIRMREGAYKLLVASTKREQVLNASKNLLTSNTRIKAYMTELQRTKEDQDLKIMLRRRSSDTTSRDRVACKGKVALSGLRVPLMWKDSDHFNNKGSSRRVAVFCLMKTGAEVFDTELVVVDRSVTDICFEGTTIFCEARPQFELTLELYSCAMEEETTLVNTPKKLARKLRSSFGKASGKKLCPLLDSSDPESFLQYNPVSPDAKYNLLAYTMLGLAQADGSFQSHSLIIMQNSESSSWLPLYGNLCCRLVAQPDCMIQPTMKGYLSHQQNVDGVLRCCNLYCVLKAGSLSCYYTPEEIDAKLEAALIIPVNKETRIRVVDKEQRKSSQLVIINPLTGEDGTHIFTLECREELDEWTEAFWQHFYDQDQWQHCCHELLKIDVASPKKPPLFLTKRAESVYNDLSIGSPGKFESLTDIIHNKIEETGGNFLIGQKEEVEPPHWAALFEGSHPMVVQKTVVSPKKEGSQPSTRKMLASPNTNATKKRRAPPPPPDKQPFVPSTSCAHQQEKENPWKRSGTKTGRPSLDAKFSAIIQQLQKNQQPARKMAPLGHMAVMPQGSENQTPEPSTRPVAAPRQKRQSFKEKMHPKGW
ncbi:rhotekin-2 [Arapaima gigas]